MESSSCLHTQIDMQTSGNNNPVDELHAILNRFRIYTPVDETRDNTDTDGSEHIDNSVQKTDEQLKQEEERNKRRCPKCNCLPLRVRISDGNAICRCGNVWKLQEPTPYRKALVQISDPRTLDLHCPVCKAVWGDWYADGSRRCRHCNNRFFPAIDEKKVQKMRDAERYNISEV